MTDPTMMVSAMEVDYSNSNAKEKNEDECVDAVTTDFSNAASVLATAANSNDSDNDSNAIDQKWQQRSKPLTSTQNIHQIRNEFKEQITEHLQYQCQEQLKKKQKAKNHSKTTATTNTMVMMANKCCQSLTTHIEQCLYDIAPTLIDYQDPQTLALRIRIVLPRIYRTIQRKKQIQTLKRRRQRQLQQQEVQHNHHHQKDLLQMLNSDTRSPIHSSGIVNNDHNKNKKIGNLETIHFASLQALVDEIREERYSLVGQSCASCQRKGKGNGTENGERTPKRQSQEEQICFRSSKNSLLLTSNVLDDVQTRATTSSILNTSSTTFSEPVRNLFFHIPLVDLWDRYHTNLMQNDSDVSVNANDKASMPNLDWKLLQDQAQQHLKAYQAWKQLQQQG